MLLLQRSPQKFTITIFSEELDRAGDSKSRNVDNGFNMVILFSDLPDRGLDLILVHYHRCLDGHDFPCILQLIKIQSSFPHCLGRSVNIFPSVTKAAGRQFLLAGPQNRFRIRK